MEFLSFMFANLGLVEVTISLSSLVLHHSLTKYSVLHLN